MKGGVPAGSVVPQRAEGVGAGMLAPEYQRILEILTSPGGEDGVRVKEIARRLGLELVPARIEGVRDRAKRLAARGWVTQPQPGVFAVVTPAAGVRAG